MFFKRNFENNNLRNSIDYRALIGVTSINKGYEHKFSNIYEEINVTTLSIYFNISIILISCFLDVFHAFLLKFFQYHYINLEDYSSFLYISPHFHFYQRETTVRIIMIFTLLKSSLIGFAFNILKL